MTRTVLVGELEKGDVVGGWLVVEADVQLVKRISLQLRRRTLLCLVVPKTCAIPELLSQLGRYVRVG